LAHDPDQYSGTTSTLVAGVNAVLGRCKRTSLYPNGSGLRAASRNSHELPRWARAATKVMPRAKDCDKLPVAPSATSTPRGQQSNFVWKCLDPMRLSTLSLSRTVTARSANGTRLIVVDIVLRWIAPSRNLVINDHDENIARLSTTCTNDAKGDERLHLAFFCSGQPCSSSGNQCDGIVLAVILWQMLRASERR
jgi:hypothetical protein